MDLLLLFGAPTNVYNLISGFSKNHPQWENILLLRLLSIVDTKILT